MVKPVSWEEIAARKKPAKATLPIVLDSDVADAVEQALTAVEQAKLRSQFALPDSDTRSKADADLIAAEDRLAAARAAAEEATVTFRFVALSRPQYDDLVDAHPQTEEQKADAKRAGKPLLGFDEDTFPPALVSACLFEPKLTVEQAVEMFAAENWSSGELSEIFLTAKAVCERRRVVDLGKG